MHRDIQTSPGSKKECWMGKGAKFVHKRRGTVYAGQWSTSWKWAHPMARFDEKPAVLWQPNGLHHSETFGVSPGWWYTYPSEKYEFVSWDYEIPNIWKNKKCSKPPTRKFSSCWTNRSRTPEQKIGRLKSKNESCSRWLVGLGAPGHVNVILAGKHGLRFASRVLESLDLLVIFQLRLLDIPISVDEAIIFADFTGYIHTFLVVKLHLFADQVCSCQGFFWKRKPPFCQEFLQGCNQPRIRWGVSAFHRSGLHL